MRFAQQNTDKCMKVGKSIVGADISEHNYNTVEYCKSDCESNVACVGFTVKSGVGSESKCHIKQNIVRLEDVAGSLSYIKSCDKNPGRFNLLSK